MQSERFSVLYVVDTFELRSADVDRQSAAEMCGPLVCVIGGRPAIMSCIKSARFCGCSRRENQADSNIRAQCSPLHEPLQ